MTFIMHSTKDDQAKEGEGGSVSTFQEKQNDQASSSIAAAAQSNGLSDKELEWLGKWLKSIDDSLRSIKGMLTFFTILAVISMLLGGCSILLSLGR